MLKRLLPTCPLALLLCLPWAPAESEPQPPPQGPRYKGPLGLAVDQEGRIAYVALHTAGAVAEVDLRSGKVLREVAVGRGPHDLARAGGTLFVTCEEDDTLVRIDPGRLAVTGRWRVGQAPRGVAASTDGAKVFVACHDERELRAVDVT